MTIEYDNSVPTPSFNKTKRKSSSKTKTIMAHNPIYKNHTLKNFYEQAINCRKKTN